MPLIFDPEYQAELEKYRDRTFRTDRRLYWLLLYMALGFTAVFGVLRAVGADLPTVISAMIAVAGLGLACVIIVLGTLIHATLVINGAGDEWVGRKQLGEYEPPASGT